MKFSHTLEKMRRSPLTTFKEVLDESVVLHHPTGNYFSLNHTGAAIWNYCSEERSPQEIVDFVSSEYEAEKESIEHEICQYLQELIREGLLEIAGAKNAL